MISNTPGVYTKRLPVGFYDKTIVTQAGEDRFAVWDDYACEILLRRINEFQEVRDGVELLSWYRGGVNYALMKLFVLSDLWRANASSLVAFNKVRLGRHERILRDMLLSNNPGPAEKYSVCVARRIDDGFGTLVMDPFRERYQGVNFYRVYAGRLRVLR